MKSTGILLACTLLLGGCASTGAGSKKAPPAAGKIVNRTPEPAEPAPLTLAPEAPPPEVKVLEKDPSGCTWIESEATIKTTDRESPAQAKAAAVAEARKAALENFLGVRAKTSFLHYEAESLRSEARVTENILKTTRDGRIMKERVGAHGYRPQGDCETCRFHLRLRACILQDSDKADRDFAVDLKVSRQAFYDGDEGELRVTATRDCYVYIYDTYSPDAKGLEVKTDLMVPNDFLPEVRLAAGKPWVYPNEEVRKKGVLGLKAQLPDSKPRLSYETIRVVATKVPLPGKVVDPGNGGWEGVLHRVNASTEGDWADSTEAFTIEERP